MRSSATSISVCLCLLVLGGYIALSEAADCSTVTCQNGGTCNNHTASPPCICPLPYIAPNCAAAADYCNTLQPDKTITDLPICRNNGTCTMYYTDPYFSCDCPNGTTGWRCNEIVTYPTTATYQPTNNNNNSKVFGPRERSKNNELSSGVIVVIIVVCIVVPTFAIVVICCILGREKCKCCKCCECQENVSETGSRVSKEAKPPLSERSQPDTPQQGYVGDSLQEDDAVGSTQQAGISYVSDRVEGLPSQASAPRQVLPDTGDQTAEKFCPPDTRRSATYEYVRDNDGQSSAHPVAPTSTVTAQ